MGREVQLESEMVQEKRARLDEKNSMVEKLTKAEKQLEQEKTKAMQSSREMEDIKESMKTQQLINMEMKDYERAVNELKNQLELKTNESNSAVQGKNHIIHDHFDLDRPFGLLRGCLRSLFSGRGNLKNEFRWKTTPRTA